ncbi:hypothetical protein GIB67_028071 [Kingdonia uniflora]|uniref:Uncharacterized protein n=1 Tax=Kingdonia uniflora TaxID=39325 RepID=A0A7J7L187_9MAGN|nr:hypothetical protein GIB67_028071 [Kingdonia uniflora]
MNEINVLILPETTLFICFKEWDLGENLQGVLEYQTRIESKGKGIYQPHHLLEDIKAISENCKKRLTEGVFGDIIRSTQERLSDLFDVNGCWSGSATILPGDKPVMFYTGVDTQNRQVQNLATPKNLSDPNDHKKNDKPTSSSISHKSDGSGTSIVSFTFPM